MFAELKKHLNQSEDIAKYNHDISKDFKDKSSNFENFYQENIQAQISLIEKRRKNNFFFSILLRLAALTIFVILILDFFINITSFSTKDLCIMAIIASFTELLIVKEYRHYFKNSSFLKLFDFFQINYFSTGSIKSKLSQYNKFNILPQFDFHYSLRSEDKLLLKYKNVNIKIEELTIKKPSKLLKTLVIISILLTVLTFGIAIFFLPLIIMFGIWLAIFAQTFQTFKTSLGSKKNKRIIFKGLVMLLEFNKNFQGQTIIKKERGLINQKCQEFVKTNFDNLEKITLEDIDFEGQFEIYSTNQIEARYLLTPSFIERIKKISNFLNSESLELGFKDNQLFLAFNHSQDLFEPRNMKEKISLKEDCQKIIEEIKLITSIVDELKLDQKTGL